MREKLVAAYVEALGGSTLGPIQLEDVERCVDLVMLAREMRAAVRQGAAKVSDLTRLEGAADRAQRRLHLPAPGSASRPAPSIAEYWASRDDRNDEAEEEE